jgi:hypothetical protein
LNIQPQPSHSLSLSRSLYWGCIALHCIALRQAAQAASNGRFGIDFDYISTFAPIQEQSNPNFKLKASQEPPSWSRIKRKWHGGGGLNPVRIIVLESKYTNF